MHDEDIRPQRRYADILVAFTAPEGDTDPTHLDAELTLTEPACRTSYVAGPQSAIGL